MKVIAENLAFCEDCTMYIEIPETHPDLTPEDEARIARGYRALGGYPVMENQEPDEFSICRCDCCGSTLGGSRHFYSLLSNED
jgi:hypothetical protein